VKEDQILIIDSTKQKKLKHKHMDIPQRIKLGKAALPVKL